MSQSERYGSGVSRIESVPKPLLIVAAIVVSGVLLVAAGNYAYWVGEGRPGTPQEFRDRVAANGLEVNWLNNGASAGDGTTKNDCGDPVLVTVNDLGGELWLSSDLGREPLTAEAIDRLVACG